MRILLILFLVPTILIGQVKKTARIVILNPEEFLVDPALTYTIPYHTLTDEQVQNCISNLNKEDDRDFVRKMNELQCEFMRTMDVSSDFTIHLNTWLTFKLYGIFDDAVIYPIRTGERTKKDYKVIADQYEIDWILNLKKVEVLNESDSLSGIATIELWNRNSNEIALSTDIEIDDNNYYGEMSCDEGTINCIMINGSVYITHQILESMFSKKKYWR